MPPEGDTQEVQSATVDTDKVTAALRDAARQDMAAEGGDQPTPPAAPEAPASDQVDDVTNNQPAAAEQQAAVDSFMNIDPATLPPELQAQYRNMQAHFTRATQEVAPYRDLATQYGVTAEEMAQAMDFVGRIQSDPAYTQQVYTSLGEYLSSLGFREPQAAPAPAGNDLGDGSFPDFDPSGDSPVDNPNAGREVGSALEQRLAQVEQLLANQDQQLYMRDLATQIKQAEFAVRESHPDWKDGDIQRIYELAPAHDGDLIQAAAAYEAWRADILQGYLEGKATATGTGTPNAAATGTEAPTAPTSLREATLRAEEALNAALGD